MSMEGVIVRPMEPDEMDIALTMAESEGWNPGIDDGRAFFETDPEGFIVAELDDEVVGTASVVRYERYSFLGLYMVRPDLRGRGIGSSMYRTLMDRDSRTVVFDGVMEMVPKYEAEGFRQAFQSVRFRIDRDVPPPSLGMTSIEDVPFDEIVEYDSDVFMSKREVFLRGWFGSYGASVAYDGHVRGYGTVRPCGEGHKVGPLFADGPDIARDILSDLCHGLEGPVFLDVPLPNLESLSIVQGLGAKEVFRCARMYGPTIPAFPLERIYGITTFELG